MKAIGWLVTACITFALLKLAMVVLAIALCILIVWWAINRPREALVIASVIGFLSFAHSDPAVFITLVVIVLTACLIGKALETKL